MRPILLALAFALCQPALATLSDPAESRAVLDVDRLLARNLPAIVVKLTGLVRQLQVRAICFTTSEGASKIAFAKDWDIFAFKFGQGGGSLIVALSEADEQELVRYLTTPAFVGKATAEHVRAHGTHSIAELWGTRIRWGLPEAPAPEPEPEPELPES